jgi:hypothetical protein
VSVDALPASHLGSGEPCFSFQWHVDPADEPGRFDRRNRQTVTYSVMKCLFPRFWSSSTICRSKVGITGANGCQSLGMRSRSLNRLEDRDGFPDVYVRITE